MDSIIAAELGEHKNKKTKSRRTPPQVASDSDATQISPADKLCEDELSTIFSHSCLSTRDLLNFRFVNKSWRDAATVTLLRKESCYVALEVKASVFIDDVADQDQDQDNNFAWNSSFAYKPPVWKYGTDKRENINHLCYLTTLLSNSPKFPTSHFILHSCKLYYTNYLEFPDLQLFFKLHGEKIQTFRPHGCMSHKTVQDIILLYAPKLQCLDLRKSDLVSLLPEENENNTAEDLASKWDAQVLPFKSLILSSCFDGNSETYFKLVQQLLSAPSKLTCIKNVTPGTLPLVLNKEKAHLVTSFVWDCFQLTNTLEDSLSPMKKFAALHPKLSKLSLELDDEKLELVEETLPSINALLESSKQTLTSLHLFINPFEKELILKIPPMKNLKSITLWGKATDADQVEFVEYEYDMKPIFVLEEDISPKAYFPSLLKVSLRFENKCIEHGFGRFFNFKSKNDDNPASPGNGHIFKSVEILEVIVANWPTMSDAKLMSQGFMNVRVLITTWSYEISDDKMGSSLWVMCPQVEMIHIWDISLQEFGKDMTCRVDAFFTGFHVELCRKLQGTGFPQHMDNRESWEFLRTSPSVCDLKHLKELKLSFRTGTLTLFASYVTGMYAFLQMPNTKFILACDTNDQSYNSYRGWKKTEDFEENNAHYERCFASIKPYVQIVEENKTDVGLDFSMKYLY